MFRCCEYWTTLMRGSFKTDTQTDRQVGSQHKVSLLGITQFEVADQGTFVSLS